MKQDARLHNGFGLMEVMIALAMAGTILTAAYTLSSTVMKRTYKSSSNITHTLPLLSVFLEVREKGLEPGETRYETKNEGPAMEQTYERKDVSKGSVLDRFKGLQQETVTGIWMFKGKQKTEKIVKFMFTQVVEVKKDQKSVDKSGAGS